MDFQTFVELRDRLRNGQPAAQAEARRWLKSDIKVEYVVEFLQALLTQCPDEQLLRSAESLLLSSVNKRAPGFELLGATLLKLNPESLSWILQWLSLNPEHFEAPFVIGMLADHCKGDDKNIVKIAINWIDLHPEHRSAAVVLRALARCNQVDTNELVRSWIASHPQAKVGSLLALQITQDNSDESLKEAFDLIKSRPVDPDAGFVLVSLLETRPSPELKKLAKNWIKANPEEFEAIKVLKKLL